MIKLGCIDPTQNSLPEFESACKLMRKMRKHDAMCIIKTWVNSWTTSYRYRETPRLTCLLGCQSHKDCLSHYLDCPQLQRILEDLLIEPPSSPLAKAGLDQVSRESMYTTAAIFAGYHSVKRSHFVNGLDASPLNFEQTICAQRLFAQAFQVAADDMNLPCRSAGRFVFFSDQC